MRFAWIALVVSILFCTPLVGGCGNAKKEASSGEGMVTPSKKKKPRGVEQPPVLDPSP
jgi:hypothetical protein